MHIPSQQSTIDSLGPASCFEFSAPYLRRMHTMEQKLAAFERLLKIMEELREKCPWDKKQTIETLRQLTIEETFELADAISQKNTAEIKNELGDVLLHISIL